PLAAQLVVRYRLAMLATVELDAELLLDTVEIQYVASYRMLPSEFCTGEAAIAQQLPQQGFGNGHATSHFPGPGPDIVGESGWVVG
ncbi:MAG: hypothetical protein ABIO19_07345, partial [Burkholderiaceae bacterium]